VMDLPASEAVMERLLPENEAVTLDGLGGKTPSSWACNAALTSWLLHAKSALVVTLLPSKNLNGFGSFEFAIVGNVVGTMQAAWRSSTTGAARATADRSGMIVESFMLIAVHT